MSERYKELLLNERFMMYHDDKTYKEMIEVFISLIRCLQMELGDINSIKITQSYEMKFSDFTMPIGSKILTFLIKDYDTEQKIKECISKYTIAYNNLSKVEKEIFNSLFFDSEDNVCYIMHPRDYKVARKSTIVKFATSLGFHRIKDEFLKGGGAY